MLKKLKKKEDTVLDNDRSEQCGIECVITIKINARIRITRNIDVSVGLVNGALGTIISVSKDNNGQVKNVKVRLNARK